MRIKQENNWVRVLMNRTTEGNDLGGGHKADVDDWGIDQMGFIDDPQELALLDEESDLSQSDLHDLDDLGDGDNGTEEEGEEEGEEGEEGEESDEDEGEEGEESDEDEGEESDDAEAEEEGEESDKEVKDEQPEQKPDNTFVSEIKRLRNRAQEAEANLRNLQKAVRDGGAVKTEAVKAAAAKLEEVQDKYEDALLDGDKEAAKTLRVQMREAQDEYNRLSTSSLVASQQGVVAAKQELVEAQNQTLALVFKRYPQLDLNSGKGNQTMINIVNGLIQNKINGGANIVAAISEAVEEGAVLLKLEAADGETKKPAKAAAKKAEKRNKEAVKRRIDAVQKPNRSNQRRAKPTNRLDIGKVGRWSDADFDSPEGQKKLEQDLGIKFTP